MKCPACGKDLSSVTAGGLTVQCCVGGCGGLLLDHFQMQKVDAQSNDAGASLVRLQETEAQHAVDTTPRRHCPKCKDIVMMRHYYSVKRKVQVNECAGCGALWLDAGELAGIRSEYQSDEQREADTQEYFSELFDSDIRNTLQNENEELRKRHFWSLANWHQKNVVSKNKLRK